MTFDRKSKGFYLRKIAGKRKIITICGSVIFEEYFRIVNAELTIRGHIVLAPGIFNHNLLHKPHHVAETTKAKLDLLHKDKIEMSDAIFVIDVAGYTGDSTKAELNYATEQGKVIYWWSKGDLFKL